MNIFKISYKVVRKNNAEIYKGFGFKHLSDATQYYVHPDNQSYKGTTTLCQPIGEAVNLFSLLLAGIMKSDGTPIGNYFTSADKQTSFIIVDIPDDWRDNGVVESNLYTYKALFSADTITVSAYDAHGRWLDGNMEHLHPLYKLLPCFCVLLAYEMQDNVDFSAMLASYVSNPSADTFVNIHEDFYQAYKTDEYSIVYSDLSFFDTSPMLSFVDSYKVIKDNIAQTAIKKSIAVTPFAQDDFPSEYLQYIPALSDEFVLPAPIKNICNAVTAADIISVLFHGPAGTGKTISCKLVCQAISLPILETVNCTENLDEFVLGKFIPQGDRIIFNESYVTKAIRYGGAVVFEEINFAKPQYLAFLNSLLDDNGFVRLDNGETVKRHPNFRFFATMNFGYFGTKELNQSLYNRFNAIIEVAALSDEAIARMLVARVPECKNVIDKVLSVYHKLKKKIDAEELAAVISPRNLENWMRLAKYDGYIRAAEKTIIPIAKCDRILEETIRGIILLYKWK